MFSKIIRLPWLILEHKMVVIYTIQIQLKVTFRCSQACLKEKCIVKIMDSQSERYHHCRRYFKASWEGWKAGKAWSGIIGLKAKIGISKLCQFTYLCCKFQKAQAYTRPISHSSKKQQREGVDLKITGSYSLIAFAVRPTQKWGPIHQGKTFHFELKTTFSVVPNIYHIGNKTTCIHSSANGHEPPSSTIMKDIFQI